MFVNDYKSLYRAKIYNSNQWIEGSLIILDNEHVFICPRHENASTLSIAQLITLEAKPIQVKTICRSFMYQDDSGKTIYDKDIIEFQHETSGLTKIPGEVERFLLQWNDEGQEFQVIRLTKDTELMGDVNTYFFDMGNTFSMDTFILMIADPWGSFRTEYGGHTKVVGNAYDNPELLLSDE